MLKVQDYIKQLEAEGLKSSDIAIKLGVSQPMVSSYRTEGFNCNLKTATYVYRDYGVVLHPFAKESLQFELNKVITNENTNI